MSEPLEPDVVESVYATALEYLERYADTATSIGVASLGDPPVALVVAGTVSDDEGVITRARILEAAEQGADLGALLVLAGIRAVSTAYSELARILDR